MLRLITVLRTLGTSFVDFSEIFCRPLIPNTACNFYDLCWRCRSETLFNLVHMINYKIWFGVYVLSVKLDFHFDKKIKIKHFWRSSVWWNHLKKTNHSYRSNIPWVLYSYALPFYMSKMVLDRPNCFGRVHTILCTPLYILIMYLQLPGMDLDESLNPTFDG